MTVPTSTRRLPRPWTILAAAGAAALSAPVSAQLAEAGVALNGTNLTYYPRPAEAQCHADCAGNPQCRGSTWIQAGTYKPADPAMCYLLSAVTGKSPARGHVSLVKPTAPSAPTAPIRPRGPVVDPNELGPSDLSNF